MANRNLHTTSKLTEFAPLSPEDKQSGVGSFISKIFKLSRGETTEKTHVLPTVSDNNQEHKEDSKVEALPSNSSSDANVNHGSQYPVDMGEGRSLQYVLKRISNLLALKNVGRQGYRDTDLKQYWMPDSVSHECYDCGERFTTFRRRHHCRICGQIFCSRCCCQEVPGKIVGCSGDLRVCTYCCKVVLSYLQSADMSADLTADLRAVQEDLQSKFGSTSSLPVSNTIPSPGRATLIDLNFGGTVDHDEMSISSGPSPSAYSTSTVTRKHSLGYQEERFALGRDQQVSESLPEEGRQWFLRALCEELLRPGRALPIQTVRVRLSVHQGVFTGSQLIDWLIEHGKAIDREEGFALGGALLEAGFIEGINDNSFMDGCALYRFLGADFENEPFEQSNDLDSSEASTAGQEGQEPSWVKEIPHRHHDSTTTTDSEPECSVTGMDVDDTSSLPSSSSMFCLNLNLKQSTVHLMRPPQTSSPSQSVGSSFVDWIPPSTAQEVSTPNEHLNYTLLRSSQGNQDKKPVPWHQMAQLRSDNGDLQVYTTLNETFSLHEHALLTQLLNAEGLSMSWSDIVMPLIHQIVAAVQPNTAYDTEEMDIRHYIQFKKVMGGQRSECQIVNGIVCTKNVAHRSMVSRLENPRILLLNGAIVYQRVEGRLLSLEPVMRQEQEYLRNVVARIESLQPDLILVSRNVSRLAQESLRLQGVTLALNVKLSVLERVARCTGARIISSVDSQIGRPQLGTCKSFYVRTFRLEKGVTKTLMFFEGCPLPRLGCSILLRGGSQSELSRLKRVMRHLAFARYNWRLELSYLMDECARPPNTARDSFFEETASNHWDKKFDRNLPSNSGPDPAVCCLDTSTDDANPVEVGSKPSKKRLSSDTGSHAISTVSPFNCKKELPMKDPMQTKLGKVTHDNVDLISLKSRRSVSSSEQYDMLRRSTAESIVDFSDPLHQYLNEGEDDLKEKEDGLSQQLAVAKMPFMNHFRKALDDTILSISPYVKFSVPFLETELGRSCPLRQFFPEEIFRSHQFSQNGSCRSRAGTTLTSDGQVNDCDSLSQLAEKHPFVLAKLTWPVDSCELQELLANFRACGGRISIRQGLQLSPKSYLAPPCQTTNEDGSKDVLNPENHQHLYVSFCSFSPLSQNAPDFCVNPWVVKMDFFGRNDISLGSFLERYCFRTSYECPSVHCSTPMLKHTRRFVHFPGCVQVTLQTVEGTEALPSSDHILMWSCCSLCSVVSPVVPMSQDTWALSFGKYLELRFHGDMYCLREEDTENALPCSHSLHHDFYQYFGYRNVVASFKYAPICVWEVSFPPQLVKLEWDAQHLKIATDEIGLIAVSGQQVFSHVLERLLEMCPEDMVLKTQLQKDQAQFKAKVDDALAVIPPSSELEQWELLWRWEDAIVDLLRAILDAVCNWNNRLLSVDPRLPRPANKPLHSSLQDTAEETMSVTTEENPKTILTSELVVNSDMMKTCSGYNTPVCYASIGNDSSGSIEDQSLQDKQANASIPDGSQASSRLYYQQRRSSSSDQEPDMSAENAEYLVINSSELPALQSTQSKSVKTILSQLLPSGPITTPITVPPHFQEIHIMPRGSAKIPVAVRESQPSTIIAHALASNEYQRNVEEMLQMSQTEIMTSPSPQVPSKKVLSLSERDRDREKDRDSLSGDVAQSSELRRAGRLSFLRAAPSSSVKDTGNIESVAYSASANTNLLNSHYNSECAGANVQGSSSSITSSPQTQAAQPNTAHKEVQFNDSSTNFFCRIFYAEEFSKLRRLVWPSGEEGFIRSLAHCVQWAARGGKSGSSFCKSRDDRLVLKEMSRPELSHFLERAPRYFQYITQSHQEHRPTLLGKILGVYRIVFRNDVTGAALRSNLLVIENLFYGREVSHRFDLKGSVRNRMVNPGTEPRGEVVLLDENLVKLTRDNPLYVLPHSKTVLNQAICRDTDFLASQSVMDYSLLVGLDEARKELVVGIIDYIRSFTWDKRLENVLKKMANQGKAPTIVQPEEYKKRFIAAMHSYFLTAPDRWYGFGRGFEF